MEWLLALGSILLLDLILSGDNAILIALACRSLPEDKRKKAMFIGCFGAIFIRVCLTLFATDLLSIAYLQFFGGIVLLYIAINLLIHHNEDEEHPSSKAVTLMSAVKTILIADLIMSLDNILALAGVAQTVNNGKWSLIICGLLASIPLVLCGSQLFLNLMNRFSIIIYFGAGILAFTAGKLMVEDQAMGRYFINFASYLEWLFVIVVLGIGYIKNKQCQQINN